MKLMVSACLAGKNCKYNGGNNRNEKILQLMGGNDVVLVCPEQMGGLPIPRVPSEIRDGIAVAKDGRNVDAYFRDGAQKCLAIAQKEQPDLLVLKARSPSCGSRQRYDGTFTGALTQGLGIAAELLMKHGFLVVDEEEILVTKRLFLRRWALSDAPDLYRYAKDPAVGPIAGWPPHQSVEESRQVIQNVLSGPACYAICRQEDARPIGCIELRLNGHTDRTDRDDECELGYWLGKPFWGNGYMPEAAKELIRYAFEELYMQKIWCGYYDGNHNSKRVQEKCGFRYQWTKSDAEVPLMHEVRTEHINLLTREEGSVN